MRTFADRHHTRRTDRLVEPFQVIQRRGWIQRPQRHHRRIAQLQWRPRVRGHANLPAMRSERFVGWVQVAA
jgi:hypothetical protein